MLTEIGHANIPVLKGCTQAKERKSDGVDFLVDMVNRYAGNVSILATGSLTNLYGAYLQDGNFFEKVSEISLMGGITEPLLIGGRLINELNFSCDPEASYNVLTKAVNIAIATGNNCLAAFFSREGYEQRLSRSELPVARYLYEKTRCWYDHMKSFELDGFFNWDVVAAAYPMDKHLFGENETEISPTVDSLQKGFLLGGERKIRVKLPRILHPAIFEETVYETYFHAQMTEQITKKESKKDEN